MAKRVKSPLQVFRKDGGNSFFEITCFAFGIDKIALTFLTYDKGNDNKSKGSITIYLEMWQADRIGHDILSGRTVKIGQKRAEEAKAINSDFPKSAIENIWGGTKTEEGAISRQLLLCPGNTKPWILQACEGPGEVQSNGLIKPGKIKTRITVPMTNEDLKEFALALQRTVQVWTVAKFVPAVEPMMTKQRLEAEAAIKESIESKK